MEEQLKNVILFCWLLLLLAYVINVIKAIIILLRVRSGLHEPPKESAKAILTLLPFFIVGFLLYKVYKLVRKPNPQTETTTTEEDFNFFS